MINYMPLDFATWIRQAYREPESTSFTIHNMEVAYQAGRASHGQAPAPVLHLVNDAFAEVAMAYPKAFALHKVGQADTAVRDSN